jgi:putative (di)nucleoside polyphosphate hydrolase
MTESNIYFRASVGILVLNGPGLVLALERSDIPDAWQAPQGGLQFGEKPVEAAERELREETGIRWPDVSVIDEFPE